MKWAGTVVSFNLTCLCDVSFIFEKHIGVSFVSFFIIVWLRQQKKPSTDEDPPEAKKRKVEKSETEMITVKKTCQFESLREVLSYDVSSLTAKQRKRMPQDYFIMRGKG